MQVEKDFGIKTKRREKSKKSHNETFLDDGRRWIYKILWNMLLK